MPELWNVEGQGRDEFAIVDDNDVIVATVPWEIETGVDPTDTAEYRRATLLAAAPDLLAALEAILDDVEGYGLAHPEGGRFECDHNDIARAAIARAKGGQ